MRIALVCQEASVPLGGPKGCSVRLRALASGLLRSGHEVHAAVLERGPSETLSRLTQQGLRITPVHRTITPVELESWLRNGSSELVIERLTPSAPQGALAAAGLGVPHLYVVPSPVKDGDDRSGGGAASSRSRARFAEGFGASDGAVAASDEVASWVRAHAPAGYPVRVIADGVDADFFHSPSEAAVAEARRDVGGGRVFRVGFFGSLSPWHDLEGVIQAIGLLRGRLPIQLVLVGDGPLRNVLLRAAWGLSVPVSLVGAAPHHRVPAYLAACDCVVVPYARGDHHPSPLKLAEAMAAGKPLIASASGPNRQLVRDGEDGLLVPPGDVQSLAAALQRLAQDSALRTRLGWSARRTAMRRYRWDDVVDRILGFARERAVKVRASG